MTTMTTPANITDLAIEICETNDGILEYGVAPCGQVFGRLSRKFGFSVYAYIKTANGKTLAGGYLIKLLIRAQKKGYISLKNDVPNRCSKCGGSGFLEQYIHVENGLCFKCNGMGTN